jgi:tetratricopeptide (TPR) repeat protein
VLAAYFLTLGALAAAALLDHGRVFGLQVLRHAPPAAVVLGLGAGLAAPLLLGKVTKESRRRGHDATFVAVAIGVAIAAGLLLRARGHYLGDGWQSLALLGGPRPYVKEDAAATGLLLRWLARAIGGNERGALLAYETLSVAAGALFLLAVDTLGRPLAATREERRRLLLFLAAGGWSLLFFGYVENYALFTTAAGAYALAGARAARDGRGTWVAAALALAATSLHVAGLLLLPSLAVLLLARTPLARAAAHVPLGARIAAPLAVLAGGLIAGRRWLGGAVSRDFLFVPLFPSRFTADGYTLFSSKHLLDVLNLAFLLLPGIAPLAVALARAPLRSLLRDGALRFALFLAASLSLAAFVLDPKLGMPRDWDFFAFTGIPWALCAFLALSDETSPRRVDARRAIQLATVLGFVALHARASTNASEERAYAQFRDDLALDPAKGRAARIHAVNHWRRLGRDDLAAREAQLWDEDYPERVFVRRAAEARSRGDVAEATRLNRDAIARAPTYSDPWNNLGSIDLAQGRVADAQEEMEIARALNPNEPSIWMNLGTASFAAGDLAGAQHWWLRAWEREPDGALVNKSLARLAQRRGDDASYERYLSRAAAAPEAPGPLLAEWGDRLAAKGRTAEALATYREALARGVDEGARGTLLAAHPELAGPAGRPAPRDLVPTGQGH